MLNTDLLNNHEHSFPFLIPQFTYRCIKLNMATGQHCVLSANDVIKVYEIKITKYYLNDLNHINDLPSAASTGENISLWLEMMQLH